jgi:hypothetical protein
VLNIVKPFQKVIKLDFMQLLKSFILFSLYQLLAINVHAQISAMDFYAVTRAGDDKVSITQTEYALLSIAYQEKKMNNWYEKFWVEEGFLSPEDMYVRIQRSSIHDESLMIVFDVTEPVIKADSTYEIHLRIADMLQGHLQSQIKLDSTDWVQWITAVNENYIPVNPVKSRLVQKQQVKIIRPENGDLNRLNPQVGKGRQEMRIPARDLAALYLEGSIEDLHLVYKGYLSISGLQLFQNAEILIEKNKADNDLLSFVFVMDTETARNDPGLKAHRNMAKQFREFIMRKVEPVQTKWLRIRFEADTSGKITERVWLTNF